ncbi:hypothetical protein R5R35_008131 [Gryllus longicercus]|uniref:furin n=1 Tax=Gryllus longicercus TaxID=2509291 RepID=A0AAN9VQG4_9ORTH
MLKMNVMCVLVLATVGQAAHYTHQWAVGIDGGADAADEIAQRHGFTNLGLIVGDRYLFVHPGVAKRSADPSRQHHQRLLGESKVSWARQQVAHSRQKRDLLPLRPRRGQPVALNDPRWPQMWYLNRGHGLDMNVQPAWQQGVSGRGVVVTILDDGLEKDHPDLYRNYDPQASYDVNNHDEDPMPRYDLIDSNRHGTRCAGEVAATANNSICAVGVAFGASVGGVRMLDGDVTDAVEARSLSLNPQHIDIYSASWGPDDDGKTVDGPGELATRAFIEGVSKGRNGKGSIFVWASGNGGRDHDNCNCDGYTNSIWTLSISSATENGLVPWYSEACSSTLATTYSSGSAGEKQVLTTDLHHQCTSSHTGTSASAPLAAGICALALESNRDLTWRDMQHIVVRTAKPANLRTSDWKTNGVGRNVSHSFGYGLMDASAMVRLARVWKSVPEQHKCEVSAPHSDKLIPAKSQVLLQLHVRECAGINYLEHVQAKISLASSRRGDLQIHLTSPAGTRTTLLARRPHDVSRAGFQNWPFMSVHTWGEKPFGIWILEIHNEGRFLGTLHDWKLVLYGTDTAPGINLQQETASDLGDGESSLGPSSNEDLLPPVEPKEKILPKDKDIMHNDILRTTTENDALSSGCIALSKKGQDCIECRDELFLFEGKCVTSCPQNTVIGQNTKDHPACLSCHYSCKKCLGPNDYQCMSCFSDSYLYISSESEKYCYPIRLRSALDSNKWLIFTFVAFFINILLLILVIAVFYFNKKSSSKNFHYSKIGNTNYLDDKLHSVLHSKSTMVCDISESESES